MRMRKKKHGAERLAACKPVLIQGKEDIAALDAPVQLEIGCGKGAFIAGTAAVHPDATYVAMERVPDVLLLAAERVMADNLTNVRLFVANAKNLTEYFATGTVSRIYLNFSDPWPKAGHAGRRLTHRNFLALYHTVLAPGGEVCFKTDNSGLFDFSLAEFAACGWTLSEVTNDLHHSEYAQDNVETEYEKNFSAKGFAIHRLVATRPARMTGLDMPTADAPTEADAPAEAGAQTEADAPATGDAPRT